MQMMEFCKVKISDKFEVVKESAKLEITLV